jgi:hypothetical protein
MAVWALEISPPPPTPCSTRNPTSIGIELDSAQPSVAAAKMASAPIRTIRTPWRSHSLP